MKKIVKQMLASALVCTAVSAAQAVAPAAMYVPYNNGSGWKFNNAPAMAKDGNVFSYYMPAGTGNEIFFNLSNTRATEDNWNAYHNSDKDLNWLYAVNGDNYKDGGDRVMTAGDYSMDLYGKFLRCFKIAKGDYVLTMDFTSGNKLNIFNATATPDALYVVSSVGENNWKYGSSAPKMTKSGSVFTYTVTTDAPMYFFISRSARSSWSAQTAADAGVNYMVAGESASGDNFTPANGQTYTMKLFPTAARCFTLPQAGEYTITMDFSASAPTMKVEKKEPVVEVKPLTAPTVSVSADYMLTISVPADEADKGTIKYCIVKENATGSFTTPGATAFTKTYTEPVQLTFGATDEGKKYQVWAKMETKDKTVALDSDKAHSDTFTYTKPQPEPELTMQEGEQTVFFKNAAGWTEVYAYTWETPKSGKTNTVYPYGTWPGTKMTLVEGNVYKMTLDDPKIKIHDYAEIIFSDGNDNGTQTEDLNYVNGGYYSNETADGKIGKLLETIEGAGEITIAPAEPAEAVIPAMEQGEQAVFFENSANWDGFVYAYVYMTEGTGSYEPFGAWPGAEAEYLGGGIWKIAYTGTRTIPEGVTLVFSNRMGNQTEDYEWTNGGYYNVTKLVKTIKPLREVASIHDLKTMADAEEGDPFKFTTILYPIRKAGTSTLYVTDATATKRDKARAYGIRVENVPAEVMNLIDPETPANRINVLENLTGTVTTDVAGFKAISWRSASVEWTPIYGLDATDLEFSELDLDLHIYTYVNLSNVTYNGTHIAAAQAVANAAMRRAPAAEAIKVQHDEANPVLTQGHVGQTISVTGLLDHDGSDVVLVPSAVSDIPTGIDSVELSADNVAVAGNAIIAPEGAEVYTVSGTRTATTDLAPGIYVVRLGAKAVKVMVR